ncbi:MAG TPA: hypothetical protein VFZ91_04910 [Allosphingosinicella sp.]
MKKRHFKSTPTQRALKISDRLTLPTLDALPDNVELTEAEYFRLASLALRRRRIALAMVFLASRELMRRSVGLAGERRLDGSGFLDWALPPLDAIDAIACLDEERERWIAWHGHAEYLQMRRRASIRIVLSHYARRAIHALGQALRLRSGGGGE